MSAHERAQIAEATAADLVGMTPPPVYADVNAILDGGAEAPVPTLCARSDGALMLYAGTVNTFFGAPESAKTLAARHVAACDVLAKGGRVLWMDVDYNGDAATLDGLLRAGAPEEALRDRERFRLCSPEGADEVREYIADMETWLPTLAVLDSVGEIIAMFGGNSNDADDYTRINRETAARLARRGACVIVIDHEAKNTASREYGASGTMAKKRATDGAYLRFTILEPFTPGKGGRSRVSIVKDRHGGLRAQCGTEGRGEPTAAHFVVDAEGRGQFFATPDAPRASRHNAADAHDNEVSRDAERLLKVYGVTRPSVKQARGTLGAGQSRAVRALALAYPKGSETVPENVPGGVRPEYASEYGQDVPERLFS